MAKVQIIMPVTLDGFLPKENEQLMTWIRTDKQGFPFWEDEATFNMYPYYGILDMMEAKKRHGENCTYFMKIDGFKCAEYAKGLFLFHLVDEIVMYLLPVSYGNGTNISQNIRPNQWQLYDVKIFKNHICRIIYRKQL